MPPQTQEGRNPYQTIFHNSLDAQIIVDATTGIIQEANETVHEVLGYHRKELIGMAYADILKIEGGYQPLAYDVKSYGTVLIQSFKCADGCQVLMDLTATMIPWNDDEAFLITIRDASERIAAEEEKEKLIRELQKAMDEIQTLNGLLPICAYCKNVRDDQGYWQKVEIYISKHSKADFSHGICPDCLKKHFPEYYDDVMKDSAKNNKI